MVKNLIVVFFLLFSLPVFAWANEKEVIKNKDVLEKSSDKKNHLHVGEDGELMFKFGKKTPTVICTPLKLSEIRLEPGEILNDTPEIGDSSRWSISPIRSGKGKNQRLSIIVKPYESGLETNLVLATNKRTYMITLKSDMKEHTQRVGFIYPDNDMKRWIIEKENEEKNLLPEVPEKIESLDFGYMFNGYLKWIPERVYNNGKQTIICMASILDHQSLPALLVTGADQKKRVVNYRVKNNRYIVDQVFDEAILIRGVGSNQKKVTIKRSDVQKAKKLLLPGGR